MGRPGRMKRLALAEPVEANANRTTVRTTFRRCENSCNQSFRPTASVAVTAR